MARRGTRVALAAGAVLLIGGTFLRVLVMSRRELWLDETHSAFLASLPMREALSFVVGDVHPPLYFVLLGAWTRWLGDSPTALRTFSLVAATLAAAVLGYTAARLVRSTGAAIFTLALCLLSPILVHYSGEVRMYSLALLFVVVGLALIPDPHRRLREQLLQTGGFVLVCALTFYAHYMGLFAVAGMCVWLVLVAAPDRPALRRAVAVTVATTVLILPWAPELLRQREAKADLRRQELVGAGDPTALNYGNTQTLSARLPGRLRSAAENAASAAGASPGTTSLATGLLAIPIGLGMIGLVVAGFRGAPASQLALLVTAATALGSVVIGATARRFLILAVPFWLLGLGELVTLLARRHRKLALALAGGLLGVYAYGAVRVLVAPRPRPLEALVKQVPAGDLVVFNAAYGEIPFNYYARRAGLEVRSRGFPVDIREWWSRQPFKGWGGPVITAGDLSSFVEEIRREEADRTVWLVLFDTRYYDPGDSLLTVLSRHALSVQQVVDSAGHRLRALRFPGRNATVAH